MRAAVASLLLAFVATAPADAAPFGAQGFVGLRLRDIPGGHAVVAWIFPGPLGGGGLTSASVDLARPDLIVSVDGAPVTAESFRALVRARRPGASLRLAYRRSRARGSAIPTALDHEDEVREITVEVGSRDLWSGTIGRERAGDREVVFDAPALLDPHATANVLGAAVQAHDLAAPLGTLLGVFETFQEESPDYHSLSRVRAPFRAPFRLPEVAVMVSAPARRAPSDPLPTALRLAADSLDIDDFAPRGPGFSGSPGSVPIELRLAIGAMDRETRRALGDLAMDEAFARQCLDLLRVPRDTFYLEGPDAGSHIEVIRASMDVDFGRLLAALAAARPLAGLALDDVSAGPPQPLPAALAGAVTGDVLGAERIAPGIAPDGWAVVGGPGPNTYDLARVVAVVDVGGNDVYHASGPRLGVRAIVDFAGDDVYTGTPDQGPAAALLGASYVDDRGGSDRYEGALLSTGAACFGASLLLDRGGSDVYVGSEWAVGAACYGAGMIFDLGRDADTYLGTFLCQGVGGPRGFGCIVDQNGRDLYRANGPEPSAYGTPAVFQSFSQGIGFGFRHYAAGGVGLISDLGGDDRYEAGEFAQGGAYYFALGILHDAAGRDLYYGNRYGQGFGVHQAHGALVDDAGDDVYWSMTAASQGAGWDVGTGLLLDRAGDDAYQCDGLGQGGASQQAIAILADLGGADRYAARPGATQGASGANTYHFGRTGALSFSVLLDLGGAADLHGSARGDDRVLSTGVLDADDPARSRAHGLFIDQRAALPAIRQSLGRSRARGGVDTERSP